MKTETKELAATVRQMASAFFTEEVLPLRKLCNEAADRLQELERELAAKDAHADEIYKAAVDLAKKLEDDLEKERDQIEANHKATELIEGMLYAERALADRLAGWLDTLLSGYDDAKEIAPFDVTENHSAGRALAAWKKARNDT